MPTVHLTLKDRLVETAHSVHFERYPEWSIDVLLLHPMEATHLCDEVRTLMRRPILRDHEILGPYLSARKASRLPEKSKPLPRRRS